jgi:hypothetical protein
MDPALISLLKIAVYGLVSAIVLVGIAWVVVGAAVFKIFKRVDKDF